MPASRSSTFSTEEGPAGGDERGRAADFAARETGAAGGGMNSTVYMPRSRTAPESSVSTRR